MFSGPHPEYPPDAHAVSTNQREAPHKGARKIKKYENSYFRSKCALRRHARAGVFQLHCKHGTPKTLFLGAATADFFHSA